MIKVEACRALGKVGRPEDATVLAQMMTLDNLEDARIAAIEGLAELKTQGPADLSRCCVDGMEHEDPAIRLASLNALRKLTRKDQGTDPAAWRRELKPMIAGADAAGAHAKSPRPARHRPAIASAPPRPGTLRPSGRPPSGRHAARPRSSPTLADEHAAECALT